LGRWNTHNSCREKVPALKLAPPVAPDSQVSELESLVRVLNQQDLSPRSAAQDGRTRVAPSAAAADAPAPGLSPRGARSGSDAPIAPIPAPRHRPDVFASPTVEAPPSPRPRLLPSSSSSDILANAVVRRDVPVRAPVSSRGGGRAGDEPAVPPPLPGVLPPSREAVGRPAFPPTSPLPQRAVPVDVPPLPPASTLPQRSLPVRRVGADDAAGEMGEEPSTPPPSSPPPSRPALGASGLVKQLSLLRRVTDDNSSAVAAPPPPDSSPPARPTVNSASRVPAQQQSPDDADDNDASPPPGSSPTARPATAWKQATRRPADDWGADTEEVAFSPPPVRPSASSWDGNEEISPSRTPLSSSSSMITGVRSASPPPGSEPLPPPKPKVVLRKTHKTVVASIVSPQSDATRTDKAVFAGLPPPPKPQDKLQEKPQEKRVFVGLPALPSPPPVKVIRDVVPFARWEY
jgi:hypothetical protein